MTLPVSKILKASKSIMAIADLKNNSPSQNVNISITTPAPDKTVSYPDSTEQRQEPNSSISASIDNSTIENSTTNPYSNFSTRDISSANQKKYRTR